MRLGSQIDLGYCTNIHRGETWEETFAGLARYTDKVRLRVAGDQPYGIGLRLSARAAASLTADRNLRNDFRRWMEERNAYVFTINGFPYGTFHGSRVKEQVYAPDWTTSERCRYTEQLFTLLDEWAEPGRSISVSTLPGSFKEFFAEGNEKESWEAMLGQVRACGDFLARLAETSGRDIHLGFEPEPLGLFENTRETVAFFERLTEGLGVAERERCLTHLGVNYDTCHFALQYEDPQEALEAFHREGIRISKVHLSSALGLSPGPDSLAELRAFQDEVYLHQVLVREGDVVTQRFRDLPDALSWAETAKRLGEEWRVHFHVPLHADLMKPFCDTRDHISGLLRHLAAEPGWCGHFEMETYTWEVLPEAIRSLDVVEQLVAEYEWCLNQFKVAGLPGQVSQATRD